MLYTFKAKIALTSSIFSWVSGTTGATTNEATQGFRKIKDQTPKTSAKFTPRFPRYFREIGIWPKNRK
jgi:hypothetical protein